VGAALAVAAVSGAVALVSIFWSARTTKSVAILQARLQEEADLRRVQADKAARLEDVVAQYRDPIVDAAFELQSRIYNFLVQSFAVYITQGSAADEDYAVRSTLFVVAQYFAWVEALKRGVQFLDLGDVQRNQDLVSRLEEIRSAFASDRRDGPAFRVFRADQRALGELMLEPARDAGGSGAQWQCAGYASFYSRLEHDKVFASWFTRLEGDVRRLGAGTGEARPRLVRVQHALIDLLEFLDPSGMRTPSKARSKIALR
jgi:hypothetical protein